MLGDSALGTGDYGLALASYEKAALLDPGAPKKERQVLWAREGLEARKSPVSLPAAALRRFAGSYGPRQIKLEGAYLSYQREGRSKKYKLLPLSQDTFLLDGIGDFRMRFVTDGEGRVTKILGLYAQGPEDESPRDL